MARLKIDSGDFEKILRPMADFQQMPVQAAAAAADTAALKVQFDALLVKLKAAGLMASA